MSGGGNESTLIRFLDDDCTDAARVGGKGANLAALERAGFPVPPAFVLTTAAFRRFLAHCDEGASPAQLAATPVPDGVDTALAEAERTLHERDGGERVYVVRSSATAEDGTAASFAGQHETYYYVRPGQLSDMVHHCWLSLYTANAVAYRRAHGIDTGHVAMAVIVQRMVAAEVSGVSFSVNPLDGDPEAIVTEACWGMGAALVDGRVTPDRYVATRTRPAVLERHIADKRVMVPTHLPADGQQRLIEVPREKRRSATLDDTMVIAVSQLAERAERAFGPPQDIEWAVSEGRLWLLQSRPITTLAQAAKAAPPAGRYVIFKPLLENFSDPFTPLTADICRRLFPPGYVIHRGRTYIALSEIRRVVPFKASDAELARFGYLGAIGESRARLSLSPWRVLLQSLGLVLVYILHGTFLGRTAHLPDDAMAPFRERVERLVEGKQDLLDMAWSLGGADAGFFAPIGWLPVPINISAARYWAWLALVRALLRRWAPKLPREAASVLCTGSVGVKSTDMGRAIVELANAARDEPAVVEVIRGRPLATVLTTLRSMPLAAGFLERFEAFLETHGHRAIKEFELAAPRWREDSSAVLAMIRNHLKADAPDSGVARDAVARRDQLRRELREHLAALPGERFCGWRWRLLRHAIRRTKYFTKLRENSRYYHIMIMGALRERIVRLERTLLERGALRCAGDVFYLEYPELLDLDAGRLDWNAVEQRIHDRRLAWVRESKRMPPRTLGFDMDDGPETRRATDGRVLRGAGASPGYYEGRARVILDPAIDADIQPGEILIAPYTDPAWTPLFLTARAAVVEIGSYLSHAGTVAREYGLPCVVDVDDCTARIPSGALIAVDGEAGTVTLLEFGGRG